MRMNIGKFLICTASILGLVACQQQDQQQDAQPATAVVNPVPAPEPVSKPKPKVKPPVKKLDKKSSTTPALVAQPVSLRPLGRKVSHVPVKGKYVALTFDDGPHPAYSRRAINILNRYGAKGTFFMLGQNVNKYKGIVADIAAAGHEIGVHTWSHIKMNSAPMARVNKEISNTRNLIGRITGTYPRVMRPPYGATSNTLVNHMHDSYGMASILWDVDTRDWRKPGVGKVISTAVNNAKPGSIILVHDIHASTISALEGIVTGLQARGFKLVTVSELMQIAKKEAAEEAAAKAAAEEAAKAAAALQTQQPQSTEQPAAEPEQPQEPVEQPTAPALKPEDFILI